MADEVDTRIPATSPQVNQTEPDSKGWVETILGRDSVKESPEWKDASMPVHRDAECYNMNHKSRGKAVIFNHKEFLLPDLNTRHGTDADRDKLASSLQHLDFEVEIYDDLKRDQVLEVIRQVSLEDHSNRDCLVIAVFSHGVPNTIYARDDGYKPELLWDPFVPSECPTLAGKPKIFFIQACQGDKLDRGTKLSTDGAVSSETVVDSKSQRESYKIPNRADFLMMYSTFPGYYSWRNVSEGSWFIQTLCKILNRHGYEKDLLSVLTIVTRHVALNFESCVPVDKDMDQMKQIPFTTSTFMRQLYFLPKDNDKCIGTVRTINFKTVKEPRLMAFRSLRRLGNATTPDSCYPDESFDEAEGNSMEELEEKIGNLNTDGVKVEGGKLSRMTLVKPIDTSKAASSNKE